MMKIKSKNKGFTLIELLIYTTVFALTAGVLTTILITTTRIENVEIVNNQVGQELNLVLETVQRLVRDSSLIECVGADQTTCGNSTTGPLLRLRFENSVKDPTCVYLDAGVIKLAEGPDPATPLDKTDDNTCTSTGVSLTTSKVTASSLNFTKFDIPGGHATVQIGATLAYNSTNPELQISKTLRSAVGRVSAATFDSNLLPDANNSIDIGSITGPPYKWKNVYISNLLGLGTDTTDPISGITPGAIYFNTAGNNIKVHNGISWKSVGLNGTLSSALTGTVSVTIGMAAVTGASTLFTSELAVGDSIKIGSEIFTVSAITDNFNLTLDSNHIAGASGVTAYRDPDLFIVDNGDSINKLTVTRSGNIGIGITNPTQKLSVAGTLGILEGGASPIFNSIFQGGDQAANITYTLPVSQGAANTTLTNNGSGVLSWAAAGGGSQWTTVGNNIYYNTGNVGIGTATPKERLEVVGNFIPKGSAWVSRTSAADNLWTSVTYGNGLFVAVSFNGAGNRVMTSPDGITWTIRTSAVDNSWRSVTYGNGLFVAVSSSGAGNRVMTSPDGITWTSRTSAANNSWMSVTYGNGLFVAVSTTANNNDVMTSPDGITWTIRTSVGNNPWTSVTYGNGLFVAVAGDGVGNRVMTSPDGITWTIRTSAVDNSWRSVTYGNGLFVAVASTGAGNRVMTSPDGITWTSRTSAVDNEWYGVTYGNGLFVAVAYCCGAGNRVMTSPDGITWTSRTSAADNQWYGVTYGNGLFVAVAGDGAGNRVMTSSANDYQGGITISGIVESTAGGFKFPDGTVQTTAASGSGVYLSSSACNTTCTVPADATFAVVQFSSRSNAGGCDWSWAAGTGTIFRIGMTSVSVDVNCYPTQGVGNGVQMNASWGGNTITIGGGYPNNNNTVYFYK